METAPITIPEQERKKTHGNYERLQIKQKGRIHDEVEIINYFSAPTSGCNYSVKPKLDMAGKTLKISSENEQVLIDFASKTVLQINISEQQ